MSKELYLFSGLGADERVFQLLDFSGFEPTFIHWISPLPAESIEQYATRISTQIKTNKPILIGLSFGGIMAIEVAKQVECEKVILIASAKTKKEIPFYFRFAGKIGLHKLLPTSLLKSANALSNWFFGASSTFEKQLLKQILSDTDPIFLKWAIDKVAKWKNETKIPQVFHIHGTKDRILPLAFLSADVNIQEGGHFMTLNKAEEITGVMRTHLLE